MFSSSRLFFWLISRGDRNDGGQATAEYALVLLSAAAVGVVLLAWVTSDGGVAKIGHMFAKVFDNIAKHIV